MPRAKKTTKVEETKQEVESSKRPSAHDFDILRAPIHTEKTQGLQTNNNTIVLEVAVKANKAQIKKAVEAVFGVKVDRVNTINVSRKAKKVGRYDGFTRGYKKAIVILNEKSNLGEIAKASQAE